MFAAVLVEMVAMMMMIIDSTTQNGLSILPISVMGSDTVSPTSCADAAVMTTPRPANSTIVSGNPTTCPTICARCDLAKRLKSGMFSDNVAQKPTIAVRPAKKIAQNEASAGRVGGRASSSLTEACGQAHTSRPTPTSISSGAAMTSSHLIDSEPRSTTQTLATQKMKKPMTSPTPPSCFQLSEHGRQHQVHGDAAKQGLDAEPAAGHQRADQRGHVGADDAERGAQHHRKGNAELRAAEGVERQRNQHDDVGDEHRPQRFAHREPEVGSQHATQRVGRHADRHAHPQRGDVPFVPGALRDPRRRDVFVEAGTRGEIRAHLELVEFADLDGAALSSGQLCHPPCTSGP